MSLRGTHLEACNCDAICPCRRIDGRGGGRSTHGVCVGALSWLVREGRAGDLGLGGLSAVMATRCSDDEPGPPWTFFPYVDDAAHRTQQEALVAILTGRLGGTPLRQFPWAWKASRFAGWRSTAVDVDHTPGRGRFRAAGRVSVRVRAPHPGAHEVTRVIPGHDRPGRDLIAEELCIEEPPLVLALAGRCAYEATFAHSSEEA